MCLDWENGLKSEAPYVGDGHIFIPLRYSFSINTPEGGGGHDNLVDVSRKSC